MPVVGAKNVVSITKGEEQQAVGMMKAGKATGLDGVARECL